jgi:hypothetical protein
MPALSNYPDGWAYGVTVRGVPLLQSQPGQVFWVGNGSTVLPGCVGGADGNPGTYQRPLATLDRAMDLCSANTGDIILVKPGHAETITTAAIFVMDKAGVAVVGLGAGSNRPRLTFGTNTTANIPITAANMSIQNFLFVANVLDIASVFTATSTNTPTDFAVQGCEFRDTSSSLNFITLITGNATANSMDGLQFCDNKVSSLGTTALTTAIKIGAAAARVKISRNYGNWAILADTAAMLAAGANSITDFEFSYNILSRPNTTSTVGNMISTSGTAWTGQCAYNAIWNLDNSAGVWIDTGTKLGFNQNFSPITGAADKSGLINPAAV